MQITRLLMVPGALCLAIGLAAPVKAQDGSPRGHNTALLSDVTGPFNGNPPMFPIFVATVPDPQRPPLFDEPARDILLDPNPGRGGDPRGTPFPDPITLLPSCLALGGSLDKLMPFCGCADIRWEHYNDAVRDAKQLRKELLAAVKEQRRLLAASPSAEEKTLIVRRLVLIEKTTVALQSTTKTLAYLGDAMDKAR